MSATDISATVTPSVAERLLDRAGVVGDDRGGWLFPDARRTWATDEALTWALALLAEDGGPSRRLPSETPRDAPARRAATWMAGTLERVSLPLLAAALLLAPFLIPPNVYYSLALAIVASQVAPGRSPLRIAAAWLRGPNAPASHRSSGTTDGRLELAVLLLAAAVGNALNVLSVPD